MPSLGNDLARIRKQQKLSIDDIHHATRIPVHILQLIEDDTVYTELDEQKTYIRSYIRSYAKVLKIEDNLIIRALDKTEAGRYDGTLRKVLGESPQEPTFSYDPGLADEDKPEEGKHGGDKPDAGIPEEGEEESDSGEETERDADSDADPEPEPKPEPEPAASARLSRPPSVDSVDWVDMGRKFTPLETRSKMWVGFAVLLIAVAAVLFFVLFQGSGTGGQGSAGSGGQVAGAISPDSLQLNLSEPEQDTASVNTASINTGGRSLAALPDTLHLVIYAASGKLEPVRVYTDVMDNLNPYWLEEGQAYRFEFVNNIRIRGQYNRMVLMLNGHVIDNFREQFYNPDTRMLEIERAVFENDSRWLQPPPDTAGLDIQLPDSILPRPTFN